LADFSRFSSRLRPIFQLVAIDARVIDSHNSVKIRMDYDRGAGWRVEERRDEERSVFIVARDTTRTRALSNKRPVALRDPIMLQVALKRADNKF